MKTNKAFCIVFLSFFFLPFSLWAANTREVKAGELKPTSDQNSKQPLTVESPKSAQELWDRLFLNEPLPPGVTINSITFTGDERASGFYNDFFTISDVQPKDGIILASGRVVHVLGPNDRDDRGADLLQPGNADLANLAGTGINNCYDAAVLKIEFTTDATIPGLSFDFIYGSEEFPEFVSSGFNDVFAAFLNGTNISFDKDGKTITVDNNFFKVSNLPTDNPPTPYDIQLDGFTPLLRTSAPLTPGNHVLEFAIADIGDEVYDSDVLISNFRFSLSDTGTTEVEVSLFNDQSFNIPDTASANYEVGQLVGVQGVSGLTYTLINNVPEFIIDENTGIVTVSNLANFDFNVQNSFALEVVAVNSANTSQVDTGTVFINLVDVGDPPPDPVAGWITADPGASSFVGTLMISLETNGDQIYYTVDGTLPDTTNPNHLYTGPFAITDASGQAVTVSGIAVGPSILTGSETFVYSLLPKVTSAWMIDGNSDGRADSVFVKFDAPLAAAPPTLTVSWPTISVDKKAPEAGLSTLGLLVGNPSVVVADFIGENQFPFGETQFKGITPIATLSDGQTVTIQDSISPIMLEAVKIPSNYQNYVLQSTPNIIRVLPDTLEVTLSEPLVTNPSYTLGAHWDSLLVKFLDNGATLNSIVTGPIQVLTSSGIKVRITIDNTPGHPNTIVVGDKVSLNNAAGYADTNQNIPNEVPIVVTGENGDVSLVASEWRDPIVGDDPTTQNYSTGINSEGITIPMYTDDGLTFLQNVPPNIPDTWIPSSNIGPGGTVINPQTNPLVACDSNVAEQAGPLEFPTQCLSSLLVLTPPNLGAYRADVQVMDHMGKFVHAATHHFGYCGELNNPNRVASNGYVINDVFWNQKDQNQNRVGSGVYIWKVQVTFDSGTTMTLEKKMGIARTDDGMYEGCLMGLQTP